MSPCHRFARTQAPQAQPLHRSGPPDSPVQGPGAGPRLPPPPRRAHQGGRGPPLPPPQGSAKCPRPWRGGAPAPPSAGPLFVLHPHQDLEPPHLHGLVSPQIPGQPACPEHQPDSLDAGGWSSHQQYHHHRHHRRRCPPPRRRRYQSHLRPWTLMMELERRSCRPFRSLVRRRSAGCLPPCHLSSAAPHCQVWVDALPLGRPQSSQPQSQALVHRPKQRRGTSLP
mmetsp:Transcript_18317/g.53539  ORF Transcript_18317/g.53539 Transcript_18317/m.53539 type:complete len:225 (-) Transcript_18317:432-1106(-)